MPRRIAVILVAVVLSGCGQPPLPPLSADAVILAFGDSLTAGVGASNGDDYPQVLSTLTGREVINAGASGDTTAGGLSRLPDILDETRPELMILLLGGNDILRNESAATTRDNLAAIIEIARNEGVEVVLLGVPEKNLFSAAAPFYDELAERYDLVYERELVGRLLKRPGYKSDPIHLNDKGYRALAEGVHELLEDSGALK